MIEVVIRRWSIKKGILKSFAKFAAEIPMNFAKFLTTPFL